MKVMIANDSTFAHFYIRQGFARVFAAMGWQCVIWDINKKSVFDAFDEFNPDIFIGQTYNTNKAVIKCIDERPDMKVFMKASDWGTVSDSIDRDKYPVLIANEKEIDIMKELLDKTGRPTSLHIHYAPHRLAETHNHWIDAGFTVTSLLNAADVFEFTNGESRPEYECDLGFVGGRWGYKSQVIDKWLIPMMHPMIDLNIKVFGNQSWGVPQYCGFIADDQVKHFFASCKICPNVHEPHSQVFGYDVIERPFKLLSNKCFVVSDYVADLHYLIPDGIAYAETPEEFMQIIKHFLDHPEEKQEIIDNGYNEVINKHTYFHRWAYYFDNVGLNHLGSEVREKYSEVKGKLEL